MADFGMAYNGSGYIDSTAYKAIMGAAKPGDIWTEGERLVLILRNQGKFCNILTLYEEQRHSSMMEITSGKRFYAAPTMVHYVFCERLGQYCQRLPRDEFARVLDEVESALGFQEERQKNMRKICHEILDKVLDEAGEA